MIQLADSAGRRRALSDFGSTLLVEAAAGTGKTALMAGRLTMLLARGAQPGEIAARRHKSTWPDAHGAASSDWLKQARASS